MENINKKNKEGFTLVETMVAITILITTVTAVFSAANYSLYASFDARDRITASLLMGEAFEVIKNIRDNNEASRGEFGVGSGDVIDAIRNKYCSSSDQKVYVDATGYYRQACSDDDKTGFTPTRLTRKVTTTTTTNLITTVVEISWKSTNNRSITSKASMTLYDWQ